MSLTGISLKCISLQGHTFVSIRSCTNILSLEKTSVDCQGYDLWNCCSAAVYILMEFQTVDASGFDVTIVY